jgi:hypothetical protein
MAARLRDVRFTRHPERTSVGHLACLKSAHEQTRTYSIISLASDQCWGNTVFVDFVAGFYARLFPDVDSSREVTFRAAEEQILGKMDDRTRFLDRTMIGGICD